MNSPIPAPGQAGEERDKIIERVTREIDGQNWTDDPLTDDNKNLIAMAVMATLAAQPCPSDADLRAFGASDAACIKWPNDTPEHKALRAAYIEGAADSRPSDDRVRKALRKAFDVAAARMRLRKEGFDWTVLEDEIVSALQSPARSGEGGRE